MSKMTKRKPQLTTKINTESLLRHSKPSRVDLTEEEKQELMVNFQFIFIKKL